MKKVSLTCKKTFCFPVVKEERACEKRDRFYSLISSHVLLIPPTQLVLGLRQFCAHSNCFMDAGYRPFSRYSLLEIPLPSCIEMACKARGNVPKGGKPRASPVMVREWPEVSLSRLGEWTLDWNSRIQQEPHQPCHQILNGTHFSLGGDRASWLLFPMTECNYFHIFNKLGTSLDLALVAIYVVVWAHNLGVQQLSYFGQQHTEWKVGCFGHLVSLLQV